MALVNRVWRESTFVPPGAEPGLMSARPLLTNVQDHTVQDIARSRFPFPSKQQEDWKTYCNRPEHTAGVRTPKGDLLFPDIVVLNLATTEVEMLAEVEIERSLREPDVVDKWQAFAGVGRLYLYVPLSQLDRTKRMLKQADIRIAGLRTWKYNMGQQKVEVLEMSA